MIGSLEGCANWGCLVFLAYFCGVLLPAFPSQPHAVVLHASFHMRLPGTLSYGHSYGWCDLSPGKRSKVRGRWQSAPSLLGFAPRRALGCVVASSWQTGQLTSVMIPCGSLWDLVQFSVRSLAGFSVVSLAGFFASSLVVDAVHGVGGGCSGSFHELDYILQAWSSLFSLFHFIHIPSHLITYTMRACWLFPVISQFAISDWTKCSANLEPQILETNRASSSLQSKDIIGAQIFVTKPSMSSSYIRSQEWPLVVLRTLFCQKRNQGLGS